MNTDIIKEQLKAALEIVGSTVTLKKPASKVYDISAGSFITTEGTSDNIKVAIESYTSNEIDGTNVRSGDIKITIINDNVTLDSKDSIIMDDINYNIVNIEPQKLDDVILAYTIQLRR